MTTDPLARLVHTLRDTLDTEAESDAALLARLRRGRDAAAAEAIVRRHGPRVLAACRKVLGADADAEDAFQATFLVLLRNPSAVRRKASLGAWLYGVAHRISLQARVRRARRTRSAAAEIPAPPDMPWREACVVLHEELDRLPEAMRLPLVLCYLDGLSRDEAAQQLGRTLGSVKKSLEKGRETLRKRLSKRGVTLSTGLLAAVAEPAAAEPVEVSPGALRGIIRPSASVTALADAVRSATRMRVASACLAASVMAAGLALAFPGRSPPNSPLSTEVTASEPPAKAVPAKRPPDGEAMAKEPPSGDKPNQERITLAGRVLGPDGEPAKGANVFFAGWSAAYPGKEFEPRTLATTGADGRFEFTVAPKRLDFQPWPYLVAAADRFGFAVQPLAKPWPKDVTLVLAKDFALSGRLLDADKRPVSGARIRVVEVWLPDSNDPGTALTQLLESGWSSISDQVVKPFSRRIRTWYEPLPGLPSAIRTDADGLFSISGIGVDRLATLLVEGTGLATSEVTVLTQPGDVIRIPETGLSGTRRTVPVHRDGFEFVAKPSRPVFGLITDGDSGRPLRDVQIRSAEGRIAPRATTNAEGRYRLEGLSNEHQELTVEPAEGSPFFVITQGGVTSRAANEPKRVDFRLTRGEWLTGRVVEARTNKPVPGARVEYYLDVENPIPTASMTQPRARDWVVVREARSEAVTGPDGRFRLLAAPGKGWVLLNVSYTHVNARQRYIQGEKPNRKPPFEMPVKFANVFSDGYNAVAVVNVGPDRNAELTITLETGVWPEIRFVDLDGKPLSGLVVRQDLNFNPDEPPPIVTAYHPDRKLGIGFRPKVGDLGPWTLTLQPLATVTARLVRKNGQPIANDDVFVTPSMVYGSPFPPRTSKVQTDNEGRVRFTDVIVGADYSFWCAGLAEKLMDNRSRSFVAKPGPKTDLGTFVGGQPRE